MPLLKYFFLLESLLAVISSLRLQGWTMYYNYLNNRADSFLPIRDLMICLSEQKCISRPMLKKLQRCQNFWRHMCSTISRKELQNVLHISHILKFRRAWLFDDKEWYFYTIICSSKRLWIEVRNFRLFGLQGAIFCPV